MSVSVKRPCPTRCGASSERPCPTDAPPSGEPHRAVERPSSHCRQLMPHVKPMQHQSTYWIVRTGLPPPRLQRL
eukprot:2316302-Lingulodinium_polyedra.AAC.1